MNKIRLNRAGDMGERETIAAIEKLKSRIAAQRKDLKRCKADRAAQTAAEQYLKDMEARLGFLQSNLAKFRIKQRTSQ